MRKFVVTGASGLLGWHASTRMHARNCAALLAGDAPPIDLVRIDRETFGDADRLSQSVEKADVILHFAGVNRGSADEVEAANPRIARDLISAVRRSGSRAHIVYANSVHATHDTPYGRSKQRAAEVLANSSGFTNLVLPHIFGEGARPDYNNVTATLIDRIVRGTKPDINSSGAVHLLHAGTAAQLAIDAGYSGQNGDVVPPGKQITVPELYDRLRLLHEVYGRNIFPDFTTLFERTLFNTYRAALYPGGFPRRLKRNSDARGVLYEAIKGGGGGQTFVSWTEPGVTRGNHFHLGKVERFLILKGDAIVRIRRVLGGPVWEYRVSGEEPAVVDMPTLHTHSIENVGQVPLLTLFWTDEIFNAAAPDTYADPVLGG